MIGTDNEGRANFFHSARNQACDFFKEPVPSGVQRRLAGQGAKPPYRRAGQFLLPQICRYIDQYQPQPRSALPQPVIGPEALSTGATPFPSFAIKGLRKQTRLTRSVIEARTGQIAT